MQAVSEAPAATVHAGGFVKLSPAFWQVGECAAAIAEAEARGFASAATHYPPSYRSNARQVFDTPTLGAALFARLAELAPPVLYTHEAHGEQRWTLAGLNPRFRVCRYADGEAFHIHRDGPYAPDDSHRSLLTFMVYLSAPESFEGGETQFFAEGPVSAAGPWLSLRPARGSMILFDHALWHAGAPVARGVKYVLRSDLVYARTARAHAPSAHRGYVWSLAPLPGGQFASGGRDGTIRIWATPERPLRVLEGHTQSVLALAAGEHDSLYSVSRDFSIRRWSLTRGECLGARRMSEATPLCLLSLPHGELVTGSADGIVRLWSGALEPQAALSGHAGWVWALAGLRANRLLSASEDGTLALWNVATRSRLWSFALAGPLRALCMVSETRAVVGDAAGALHWIDARDEGATLVASAPCHRGAVRAVTLAGAGQVVSAGEDGRVQGMAFTSAGPSAPVLLGRHGDFATALLAQPSGLLSAGYDGVIRHNAY